MKKYDVAILGGGPGGYVAAIRAAQLGKRTVLVERENIGGTCLNTGCIPTKTLIRNAEIIDAVKNSGYRGIHVKDISIDIKETIGMKNAVVAQLRQGVEGLLADNGVGVLKGHGILDSKYKMTVEKTDGTEEIEFSSLIVATGSRPAPISIAGAGEYAATSTELLDMKKIPGSMIIIGGGVIGCEFAHILNSFGSKVTVIEAMPRLINNADSELTAVLEQCMKGSGIKIKKDCSVNEIRKTNSGKDVIIVKNGIEETLQADDVMISTGRAPNLEGLEKLGLEMNGRFIKVDDTAKTSIENVYAIGDVTGIRPLAHVASDMGRVAAENIAGIKSRYDDSKIPSCVFTSPELAFTGLTEEEASVRYGNIKVGRFPLAASGKALAMGETEGFFKVVSDGESGRILGIHMLGASATEIIGEASAFIKMGASVEDVIDTVHAHPTISEAVHEAALDAEGICIHMPPAVR